MPLNPLIVGLWSGHSIWLQWDAVPDAQFYRVEIAIGTANQWKLIDGGKTKRNWRVIPCWKSGEPVWARVSIGGSEFEQATEATFARSSCLFSIQAGPRRALIFPARQKFHAVVDSAACSYMAPDPIQIEAGETVNATLHSSVSCGWAQLDHEAHFELIPEPGARIWNLEPSVNDLKITGRDHSVLAKMKRDGPISVVRLPRNPLRR